MKFVDLEFENKVATRLSSESFSKIEESGKYLLGDYLNEFEVNFAHDQGVSHAACVKNATDALYMTFKLLECEKRTIIVPSFGAYPTVIAAIQAGAGKIIAAPVDETLTLNLENVDVPKDSIIVPVNLFGNVASSPTISHAAKSTDSIIVEDCAQSTGLSFREDSFVAIHSFYPTKPLGCRGDGGAIISNDESFIKKCRNSRFYGLDDGVIRSWGFNSRMDEWQSSFLSKKIKYYRLNNETRRKNAKLILEKSRESVKYNENCVFHQLVILFANRDNVKKSFDESGIPTMIHYPKMLHDMPWLYDKVEFVETKRVSDHVLSLPVGPHLTDYDVALISSFLNSYQHEVIKFDEIS